MKAKSLSVFRTKLFPGAPGTVLVKTGDIIEGDEAHLNELARNKLVVLLEDDDDLDDEGGDGGEEKPPEAEEEKAPAAPAKGKKPKG